MIALLAALSLTFAPMPQDDGVVRAAQQRRIDTIARVAPAVCTVLLPHTENGGSGVVIDPRGFVLTNYHVVQRARGRSADPDGARGEPRNGDPDDPAWNVMRVGLPDGRVRLADILGIDPGSDLALLLLRRDDEHTSFPSARLGDSDRLRVGDAVFAMGNPFMLATDFTPTVTWGIVSGIHRYQSGAASRWLVYPDCIQVDAPVNPGNSGGPLFDALGEVVGINGRISIRDRRRVNTGVGFAIASRQIRNFLPDLMAGRHAEHGTLDFNAWLREEPKLGRTGVFVQSIFADSTAAELGLALGDEITKLDGEAITSANQLARAVGILPAGTWVTLGFRHGPSDGVLPEEREIVFALRRLDTGSSRATRLASEEFRRLAREVLVAAMTGGAGRSECSVVLRAADRRIAVSRRGDALRYEDGDHALVLLADGAGFVVSAGDARDASDEDLAAMRRLSACCPLLWHGDERLRLVAESTLEGGVVVSGVPAYRFAVTGDGEHEAFLFADGTPAGFSFREPFRGGIVECRCRADGRRAQWIENGRMTELNMSTSFEVAPSAFERPR